jgi:outer membrane protein assembly factor BamD (BamD/ComL family)
LKSTAYKAVQAGHAVAEFMLEHPGKWNNGYLIYLEVEGYDELFRWYKELRDTEFSFFVESDMNNEMTAIAVLDNGELFKDLKLLK